MHFAVGVMGSNCVVGLQSQDFVFKSSQLSPRLAWLSGYMQASSQTSQNSQSQMQHGKSVASSAPELVELPRVLVVQTRACLVTSVHRRRT